MKPALSILPVLFFAGFLLSGCNTLHEAIMGRKNPLAPLDDARLGRTSREEILERFGTPDEIDQRRHDTSAAEVFYYYDQDEGDDSQNGYLHLKILACEFVKDRLTGYVFQDISQSGTEGFDESARGKLTKSRTSRRETEEILGVPNGKSLIPTTLNLPALAGQIGGVPAPFTAAPENAREVWLYNAQSFDAGLRRPSQRSLAVFFDDQGIYLGSAGLQQIASKVP